MVDLEDATAAKDSVTDELQRKLKDVREQYERVVEQKQELEKDLDAAKQSKLLQGL